MTWDCVLTHHADLITCGLARFNYQLAERLGIPCYQTGTPEANAAKYPLVSIHPHELTPRHDDDDPWSWPRPFDLFLHSDFVDAEQFLCRDATRVYRANATIQPPHGVPASTLWCPSTLQGAPARSGIRILTFGMAQKVQWDYHVSLKAVLDASHVDYSVNLSCAVHEGDPWERTIGESWTRLRAIYGDHARLLGYLADDALLEELARSSGVAAFFPGGVRGNNTTAWAALEHKVPLITNLDTDSPPCFKHEQSVLDIAQLTEWPMPDVLRRVRYGGSLCAQSFSWARLIDVLKPATVTV